MNAQGPGSVWMRDWLAPPIKEGHVDPRNSLAFRKPSWNSPLTSDPKGGPRTLGIWEWLTNPCSCKHAPSSQRCPSLISPWRATMSAFYPRVLKAAPASTPVTFPGQPSPSLPGLLLPDFAPYILLPHHPRVIFSKPRVSCGQLVPYLPFYYI